MVVRCLVAHEAEFMRMLMSDILIKNGFEVAGSATTGVEAVELYESLKPDLLTLDFRLPELDGIAALREIRLRDPDARVVMCSSIGEQTQVKDALSAGAQEIIVKPFHEDRVIDAIKKCLR